MPSPARRAPRWSLALMRAVSSTAPPVSTERAPSESRTNRRASVAKKPLVSVPEALGLDAPHGLRGAGAFGDAVAACDQAAGARPAAYAAFCTKSAKRSPKPAE